jgi:hypothetical protein
MKLPIGPRRFPCAALVALVVALVGGCRSAAKSRSFVDAPDADRDEPPVVMRDAAVDRVAADSAPARADTGTELDDARPMLDAAADVAEAGGPAAPGPWAQGLAVGLVEATQAVFIEIGNGAQTVAPADRNSTLMEKRAMFVRVHVKPAGAFTPRRLRAVLTLSYSDGTSRAFEDAKLISGASTTEKLESSFNFLVPADAVRPGAQVMAAVYEPDGAPAAMTATPPRFPPTGTADLAIAAGPMTMDVVLMLMKGPSGPLDDSAPRRRKLESYLADVYPVQKMTIRWRAPQTIDQVIDSATAFKLIGAARRADDAPPGSYYHMIIAVEDSVDKYLGLGRIAGPAPSDGANRIAMTMVRNHQVDHEWDTVSHEMGHNLGRQHAPGCNVTDFDKGFPYADTGVGVDGYSIPEMAFKSRLKWKDVMGYCYPTWISDYTWNAFAARVRIISAFDAPTMMLARRSRSLRGYHAPGRPAQWLVVDGPLVPDGAPAAGFARVHAADGGERVSAVAVEPLLSPAGPVETLSYSIDLPDEDVTQVEVFAGGERFVVGADVLSN